MPGARGHKAPPPGKKFGHLTIKPGVLKSYPETKGRMMASALNGGTAAQQGAGRRPPAIRPLGPLLIPRGRRGRGAVNPLGRGMMNPPGQGTPAPSAGRGRGRAGGQGQGKGPAVGNAALTSPVDRQLASRISSGKITQAQADRTLAQRATLKKAFGTDWRSKLSVGGKTFADVNQGLVKNPGNPRLAALRKKLLTNRSSMLTAAKAKGKKPAAPATPAIGEGQ